jgi:hypothetical protein
MMMTTTTKSNPPEPRERKWLNTVPTDQRPSVFVGMDIGQARNYTALATLERRWVAATVEEFIASAGKAYTGYWDYRVTKLERIELGTSYVDIAHWVKDYLDSIYYPCHKHLVMDATGVGTAVRDLFRDMKLKANLVAVTLTASNAAGWRPAAHGLGVSTSRTEVLTKLVTTMEQRIFAIDKKCRFRDVLFQELVNMQMSGKPAEGGSSGGQDDLAFALALAVWWGVK